MKTKPRPLALVIGVVTGTVLLSSANALADDSKTLHEIEVRALGVRDRAARITTPFSLLDGDRIFAQGAATLGEALQTQPGVHADTFGAGASRPVIRGQTAPRVTVLSDGANVLDASAISPDHAVTVEPLLARRVEVIRGPATLLHGGGAIGGVVNVIDNRIPEQLPERDLEGFAALRGDTVADERAAALSLIGRLHDNIAFSLEGSHRESDDYKARGGDESRVEG
ncbi:MAG: TonB-dependent receptor plug domain-containing protein, partial [Bacteroidales bacterium]|nr:TonB-dependent receptor plug domain-containing protein [Bacteroidales bacterium]